MSVFAKNAPTMALRLAKSSPAVQPAAGRTVSPHVRMKPYKLTVKS